MPNVQSDCNLLLPKLLQQDESGSVMGGGGRVGWRLSWITSFSLKALQRLFDLNGSLGKAHIFLQQILRYRLCHSLQMNDVHHVVKCNMPYDEGTPCVCNMQCTTV